MSLWPRKAAALIALATSVSVVLVSCTVDTEPSSSEVNPTTGTVPLGTAATVTEVLDGDSLVVDLDGSREEVRLIGLNAPERGECLSDASRLSLQMLAEGEDVVLVTDVTDRDRFDRLLRYVFAGDTFVNRFQVEAGFAIARAFEPDTGFQEELAAAQQDARAAERGIWSPTACGAGGAAPLELGDVNPNPPGRDSENLSDEYVTVANPTDDDVDMSQWQVKDGTSQNRFRFPAGFLLGTGDRVRVRTGCGTDDADDVFWCSDRPVWDNSGDQVFLLDPDGNIIDSFEY